MQLVVFNKPFQVLPQFTSPDGRRSLADYLSLPGLYPAGRLDYDSEGLLLLTDFGPWQARISQPGSPLVKRYRVQVEGDPTDEALEPLRRGLVLNDGPTRPTPARVIPEPAGLWPRDPPIRRRKAIPTAWIELELSEGRNRQVRRMTAAVGLPTLRLIRWAVGPWTVQGLVPGQSRAVARTEAEAVLSAGRRELPTVRQNGQRSRSASQVRGPGRN
ncbi:MAG: pseudouridine synthase [Steroidobacteraceae bacterium]|nr:pseudouridine synthase [Steroidobacteraceae bacterium]MBP7013501.1 pseudouridine synthase [Steroidobacteraceae bacterium]